MWVLMGGGLLWFLVLFDRGKVIGIMMIVIVYVEVRVGVFDVYKECCVIRKLSR